MSVNNSLVDSQLASFFQHPTYEMMPVSFRPVATCRQEMAIASSCFDKILYSICLISKIGSYEKIK